MSGKKVDSKELLHRLFGERSSTKTAERSSLFETATPPPPPAPEARGPRWEGLRHLVSLRVVEPMLRWFGVQPLKSLVGINLGSSALSMAQVASTPQGFQLVALHYLPYTAITTSPRDAGLVQRLQQLGRELEPQTPAVFASSLMGVNLHEVSLPPMPEDEVGQAIRWEVQRQLEIDVSQMTIDQIPQRNGDPQGRGGRRDWLVAVAETPAIIEHLTMLSQSGFSPIACEPAPLALLRVLQQGPLQGKADELVLLIDLGAGATLCTFVEGGRIRFSRRLSLTSRHLTQAIAEYCHSTDAEAETLKRQWGLTAIPATAGSAPAAPAEGLSAGQQVSYALQPLVERLIGEIESTVDFYTRRLGEGRLDRLDRIILSGGGARLSGLTSYLARRVGVPVEILDPFQSARASRTVSIPAFTDQAPALAVAIGLALGAEERAR